MYGLETIQFLLTHPKCKPHFAWNNAQEHDNKGREGEGERRVKYLASCILVENSKLSYAAHITNVGGSIQPHEVARKDIASLCLITPLLGT